MIEDQSWSWAPASSGRRPGCWRRLAGWGGGSSGGNRGAIDYGAGGLAPCCREFRGSCGRRATEPPEGECLHARHNHVHATTIFYLLRCRVSRELQGDASLWPVGEESVTLF